MARVEELLGLISDPALRAELLAEVASLKRRQQYGLVFERHMPESAALWNAPIRVGATVFKRQDESQAPFTVREIRGDELVVAPEDRSAKPKAEQPAEVINRGDVLVKQGFNESVYPALAHVGRLSLGGDKPYHSVIEGENYHVLQLLSFAMPGRFDAIYIDPPYNSGARDWKYNNDYVDGNDAYRHSKWLSFMEKRLAIAKQLLKPDDSVLIITIDEKEYLRLGLLLEQVFPSADIQMISSVINPKGSPRRGKFSRADEYIYFVFIGSAEVTQSTDDMLHESDSPRTEVRWAGLRRNGANGRRSARPNLFFPIYFNVSDSSWHSVGASLTAEQPRAEVTPPKGTFAVWPLGDQGQEQTWGLKPATLITNQAEGYVKYGPPDHNRAQPIAIYYLPSGPIADIKAGAVEVKGRDETGAVVVEYHTARSLRPMSVWNKASHSAGDHGATLLNAMIPGRRFPFPKSLYAVEDTLRFFVRNKPDALILDFFGGSGTTTHAVARLNHEDGGRRQSILVTNNEVSEEEEKRLRASGNAPGDAAWQERGIFDHVTVPRITAAFTGKTEDGQAIKSEYRFVDPFPMSDGLPENVEFFRLSYLEPVTVELGTRPEDLLPTLWLAAGAQGERLGVDLSADFAVADDGPFAVLMKPAGTIGLLKALAKRDDVTTIFIFTDSEDAYAELAEQVPTRCRVRMLPRDYLQYFSRHGESRS
jgi:adenine-specific DNA-methyltransferase